MRAVIKGDDLLMPETEKKLKVLVANCLIGGDEITQNENGFIRDKINLHIGGLSIQIRQHPSVFGLTSSKLPNEPINTTEITVFNIEHEQVNYAKDTVHSICWMLTFVCSCRVIPYLFEYPETSGNIEQISFSGRAVIFRPVLEIRDGSVIRNFIECTYEKYKEKEKVRELSVVFDYLAQAEIINQTIEVRMILIYIALENLKFTFLRELNFVNKGGKYFRANPSGSRIGRKYKSYGFKEILNLMFRSVGMKRDIAGVIELRNELIHTGLMRNTVDRKFSLYSNIHDLAREYLLRLLQFKGHFSPYDMENQGSVKIL